MLSKPIPAKLPGTVHAQYTRCGNRGCHCYRGELHGPYWYRFWRDAGHRQHREYVRPADLAAVRAACAARQAEEQEIREALVEGAAVIEWFLAGAKPGDTDEEMQRLLDFPWRIQQLTRLASSSHVKPRIAIRAFDVLGPLWAHYQRQENMRANMRLLLGDRYWEGAEYGNARAHSGVNMQEVIGKYSGTVSLR